MTSSGSATSAASTTARRVALQERLRDARAGRRAARRCCCCSSTRPSTRAGRRSRARRAADGRGLVPRRRASTSSRPTAAASSPTTAPGQLVGYPIMRVADVVALRAHDGARRSSPRSPTRASRRAAATARARLHGRLGRATARSPRSASTSPAASRRTASPSTSTTTSQPFEWVVPCGLDGVRMTSVAKETGAAATDLDCFRKPHGARVRARRSAAAQRLVTPAAAGGRDRYPQRRERAPRASTSPAPAPTRAGWTSRKVLGDGRRSRSAAASRRGSRSRAPGGPKLPRADRA